MKCSRGCSSKSGMSDSFARSMAERKWSSASSSRPCAARISASAVRSKMWKLVSSGTAWTRASFASRSASSSFPRSANVVASAVW